MSSIEIKNVSKAYGKVSALKNVTATITDGKICGLLGRNGAGKTTLLNILTNRIFADQGQIWMDGETVTENDRAQAKIFYMTEKTLYPNDKRVRDVFQLTRGFYPQFDQEYADNLAERFKLETGKKIGGLSTGYQSIFKLILTLASNAAVIIFDEPVLGLDANHRDLFYKELLAHYNSAPKTVILSTHLIEEAAGVLEDVIIIKEGQIILTQPVEDLMQTAYTVSGSQENVDRFTVGKKVIREEALGRFKAATIYQKRNGSDQVAMAQLGLDLSPARLQELIISLTN
ncbi:MAG TPA: ABC transporter ATP-binding protein [Anaerolinea sp.]|nr:ABC transporter ATP-binding protein [Anaerolinea sp.]